MCDGFNRVLVQGEQETALIAQSQGGGIVTGRTDNATSIMA